MLCAAKELGSLRQLLHNYSIRTVLPHAVGSVTVRPVSFTFKTLTQACPTAAARQKSVE